MIEHESRFSPPYNWCDARCERCPVIDDCPVARRVEGRRWVNRSRGRNPDDVDVVMRDLGDSMKSALAMLEADAKAKGIALSAPMPRQPAPIQLAKIRSAAMEHAIALHDLEESLDDQNAAAKALARTLMRAAAIIAPKMARLCVADEIDAWEWDAIPNLLLIEHVDAETRSAIEAMADRLSRERLESYVMTREKLHALTAHWFASIRPSDRDELDDMIEDDRAPSPFARVDGAEDDDDCED